VTVRWSWRFGLALAMLGPRTVAAAPGDATRLEYARDVAAANCPDRAALREAVKRRLGYDPFFPAARQAIVVQITLEADGLLGTMRLLDDEGLIRGTRELRERREHCEELVASLALAVSIALDPSAALQAAPEPPAATPESSRAATDAAAEARASAAPPQPAATAIPTGRSRRGRDQGSPGAPERGLRWGPRAQIFGAFGAAPGVVGGARGGLALGLDWFALTAELAYQVPATRAVEGPARARTTSWSAGLAPCYQRFSFYGCALLSAGYLTSEGEVAASNRVTSTQVALGLRLEYVPALGERVRLLVGLDALKPLLPLTFRLQEREVWASPWLTLVAATGLQLEFP
jgi:hypothetical protein